MAKKKAESTAVEAPKKEAKPQKKKNGKKSSGSKSPWMLALLAVFGMYLLTIVWPKPIEKIMSHPLAEDILAAPEVVAEKPAAPKVVEKVETQPVAEALEEEQVTVLEEETVETIDENLEIINQLNQKISALTEITETQSQKIESLETEKESQRIAMMALKDPASVIDLLMQEEAFSGTDFSLLTGEKLSANMTVVKLLEAIHTGPLSREERSKVANGNLLAESDSSWKKTLSQWVTVKKQTVEDYAMSYDEQWEAHSDKLKLHLMEADYAASLAWIGESPILSSDARFVDGGQALAAYMNQQKLLKRVRDFYAR